MMTSKQRAAKLDRAQKQMLAAQALLAEVANDLQRETYSLLTVDERSVLGSTIQTMNRLDDAIECAEVAQ